MTVVAGSSALFLLNSCGTVMYSSTKGKAPVFMCRAPNDLQASCDGKRLELESEVFAATATTNSTTTYYTSAVKLPHKHKQTIELYSPSLNKRATVYVKPKVSGKLIFLDAILTASIGFYVDIPTGNLKILKPRLIDVESALEGKPRSEWKSQGKLKRMTKRKIKRANKY